MTFQSCIQRVVGSTCESKTSSRFVSAILLSGAIATACCQPAASLSVSSTDLWNNATVTANSAIHGSSNVNDMFGKTLSAVEPGNSVFADGKPAGTLTTVDWQTAAAVTLKSFVLFASHDGPPRNANQRGFSHFELFAFLGGSYVSIFSYDTPALLYGNNTPPPNAIFETNAGKNSLALGVNLSPVVSDKFRAVFVQYGPAQCCESGVRISELDGFNTYLEGASQPGDVPVPAAFSLFAGGLGVIGLLGWRRGRRTT